MLIPMLAGIGAMHYKRQQRWTHFFDGNKRDKVMIEIEMKGRETVDLE